jgi:small subunit ribosomal protein S5
MARRDWKPKTELGKKVANGEITDIDIVFEKGWKIKEPEIVDRLLPGLERNILFIGGSPGKGGGVKRTSTRRTARMHRSGRRYRISACVVVGSPGYIGVAKAVGVEHSSAIEKATDAAKLNLIPIRRGCGSWECGCGGNHSIPFKIRGKSGAVTVELWPAPKGLGLCIGDEIKKILNLVGIKDIWSKVLGDTRTRYSYSLAIFGALKNLNKMKIPEKEKTVEKNMEEETKELVESSETAEELIEEADGE